MGTPIVSQSPRPAPQPDTPTTAVLPRANVARPEAIPDPGDQWLPRVLQDKS